MSDTDKLLSEVKAALAKATPDDWSMHVADGEWILNVGDDFEVAGNAPEWLAALVAEVERLRQMVPAGSVVEGCSCNPPYRICRPHLQEEVERLRESKNLMTYLHHVKRIDELETEVERLRASWDALGPIAHENQLAAQRRKKLLEKCLHIDRCPICDWYSDQGHADDCELAKELGR